MKFKTIYHYARNGRTAIHSVEIDGEYLKSKTLCGKLLSQIRNASFRDEPFPEDGCKKCAKKLEKLSK